MPPARLHYGFASYTHSGVILRRGPTDWVRVIGWDTAKDEFIPGQWIHARVPYFTLSPSGRYWLTVVLGHSKEPHNWIALSRPPYFTALAMWHHPHLGDEVYCEFPEEGVLTVSQAFYEPQLMEGFQLKNHHQLNRNEVVEKYGGPRFGSRPLYSTASNQALVNEGLVNLYLSGPQLEYGDTVTLKVGDKHRTLPPEMRHVRLDQRGRLIFTKKDDGSLYAATVNDDLSFEPKALANFDNQTFESIPTPDWAKEYYSPSKG